MGICDISGRFTAIYSSNSNTDFVVCLGCSALFRWRFDQLANTQCGRLDVDRTVPLRTVKNGSARSKRA